MLQCSAFVQPPALGFIDLLSVCLPFFSCHNFHFIGEIDLSVCSLPLWILELSQGSIVRISLWGQCRPADLYCAVTWVSLARINPLLVWWCLHLWVGFLIPKIERNKKQNKSSKLNSESEKSLAFPYKSPKYSFEF